MAVTIITDIRINDVSQPSLLPYIKDLTYSDESEESASTLDINFVLPDSLILPVDPELYNKIGVTITYNSQTLILDDFYIDKNTIKVKNNVEFVGSQAYNYGLGINQAGSGDSADDSNVNIGGASGNPSGRFTLDAMINLLCQPFNLDKSPGIGTHWAGTAFSRFNPPGIDAPTYLAGFQLLEKMYGYFLNFVSSTNPSYDGLCVFKKQLTIESQSPILTINRSEVSREFTFDVDQTKSARVFVILRKNGNDLWVLEATDYRLPASNTRKVDVRSEDGQEDKSSALARLEGLLAEYNQKTVEVKFGILGNPLLRVNEVITLAGFSDKINGNYVIKSARHSINDNGYICDLTCYKTFPYTISSEGAGTGDIRYTDQNYNDWS